MTKNNFNSIKSKNNYLHLQIHWIYFKIVKLDVLDVQKCLLQKTFDREIFSPTSEYATSLILI